MQKLEQNLTLCAGKPTTTTLLHITTLSSLHFILFKAWGDMEKLLAFCYIILCHNCKDPKSINFPPPLLCLQYNRTAHLLAYMCVALYFLLLYQDGLITPLQTTKTSSIISIYP